MYLNKGGAHEHLFWNSLEYETILFLKLNNLMEQP